MMRYSRIVVVLACVVTLVMTAVAVSSRGTARAMQDRQLASQQQSAAASDAGSELPSTLGPAQRLPALEEAMQKACPVSTTYRVYTYAGLLVAVAELRGSRDDDDLSRCLTLMAKANEGGRGIAFLKVAPTDLILPNGHPGQVLWQFHYILAGPDGIQWLLSAQRTDQEIVSETDHTIRVYLGSKVVRPFMGLEWSEVFSVFGATGAVPSEHLTDAPRERVAEVGTGELESP